MVKNDTRRFQKIIGEAGYQIVLEITASLGYRRKEIEGRFEKFA